jgi:hypothetical protein
VFGIKVRDGESSVTRKMGGLPEASAVSKALAEDANRCLMEGRERLGRPNYKTGGFEGTVSPETRETWNMAHQLQSLVGGNLNGLQVKMAVRAMLTDSNEHAHDKLREQHKDGMPTPLEALGSFTKMIDETIKGKTDPGYRMPAKHKDRGNHQELDVGDTEKIPYDLVRPTGIPRVAPLPALTTAEQRIVWETTGGRDVAGPRCSKPRATTKSKTSVFGGGVYAAQDALSALKAGELRRQRRLVQLARQRAAADRDETILYAAGRVVLLPLGAIPPSQRPLRHLAYALGVVREDVVATAEGAFIQLYECTGPGPGDVRGSLVAGIHTTILVADIAFSVGDAICGDADPEAVVLTDNVWSAVLEVAGPVDAEDIEHPADEGSRSDEEASPAVPAVSVGRVRKPSRKVLESAAANAGAQAGRRVGAAGRGSKDVKQSTGPIADAWSRCTEEDMPAKFGSGPCKKWRVLDKVYEHADEFSCYNVSEEGCWDRCDRCDLDVCACP